jgi:hypothetical protein
MSLRYKHYKRIFRKNLQPIFAVLVAKKRILVYADWEVLSRKTIESIRKNPSEYLGHELPEEPLIDNILDDILNEFFKEMRNFKSMKTTSSS